jgi:hypothetical protein
MECAAILYDCSAQLYHLMGEPAIIMGFALPFSVTTDGKKWEWPCHRGLDVQKKVFAGKSEMQFHAALAAPLTGQYSTIL